MASDQRSLALRAGVAHGLSHRLEEGIQGRERPPRIRRLGDPGRMLEDVAERSGKRPRLHAVEIVQRDPRHRRPLCSGDDRRVGRKRPMFTVPVPRDLEARRRPHPVELADVIEETLQPRRPAGAARKPAMQPDRHHLRAHGSPSS